MAITDTYLRDPSAFPSPAAGESWGEEELWIDFVGGPYRVCGLNAEQRRRLLAHFGSSCSEAPGPLAAATPIAVHRIDSARFSPLAPLPRELDFELQSEADHIKVAGESMCAHIALDALPAGTLWTDTDGRFFTRNIFENFFRMLVTYRLLDCHGLLLHSAAVVDEGRAYVFPGRSGSGKTTLARLSLAEGRTVLSDDMNALTWRNGSVQVEKVPFSGDLGRTWSRGDRYPLGAIVGIEQGARTALRPFGAGAALGRLVACAPYLNGDAHRMPRLLDNLAKLTAQVPAHILSVPLAGPIWPVIGSALRQ